MQSFEAAIEMCISGRQRQRVCHSQGEWARDEDGDRIRAVHTNTIEGLWTSVRNFLRPFRGGHTCYVAGDVAIDELNINFKPLSPRGLARLVSRPSHTHYLNMSQILIS